MTIWTLILIFAVLLTGVTLGAFVILLAGVRAEERHMSLRGEPGTRAGLATRRVLGVYVRNDIVEHKDTGRDADGVDRSQNDPAPSVEVIL